MSFDVWPSGFNSQSDDDFGDLKTAKKTLTTELDWLAEDNYARFFMKIKK